jgi:hypothetical protein
MADHPSIRSIKNDSSRYSSRRFRQFKEVNLFIDPKPTLQSIPTHLHHDSFK